MYEENGQEECGSDSTDQRRISKGWLIERYCPPWTCEDEKRYLQIGTGQWCAARYATLFPLRTTAVIYAVEFGYEMGKTASIVRYQSN